jgi:outer membrane receptor for ferrienterochelin and colicins
MIERIEVVRGGGSALYGSNAVAGTINLITKEAMVNSYDVSTQYSAVGVGTDGDAKADRTVNMNTTIVSEDKKTGLALFGFYRDKEAYDANDDGFSETSQVDNLTFGSRFYHRIDYRNKITLDFFRINEERRGGDSFHLPKHEAEVAEAVDHKITTTALTYERFIGTGGLWSVYASAQDVDRGSYYGAGQSLSDYGHTDGLTYNLGTQFKTDFGKNSLITGVELVHDQLKDKKLGYPNYEKPVYDDENKITGFEHVPNTLIADQEKSVYGVFAQIDRKFGPVKASLGGRFDRYDIKDHAHKEGAENGDNNGNVFSPRVNVLWNVIPELQWRVSYSQGYRAPQIFDEDLHIESSKSRKVIHANDPNLKQETSHSYMTSIDYNKQFGNWNVGFLVEGFYTKLNDAFVQTPETDDDNITTYTRSNADNGATVKGVNLETNISPGKALFFRAGYTFQSSKYGDAQELGEKDFFRTPEDYGFFSVDYQVGPRLTMIASGTYTGKMKLAYYGEKILSGEKIIQIGGEDPGVVRTSPKFFELGLKAEYDLKIANLPIKAFAGVKNLFNSYQDDFDTGAERDPAYIYGPNAPRTIYAGLKLSNVFGH